MRRPEVRLRWRMAACERMEAAGRALPMGSPEALLSLAQQAAARQVAAAGQVAARWLRRRPQHRWSSAATTESEEAHTLQRPTHWQNGGWPRARWLRSPCGRLAGCQQAGCQQAERRRAGANAGTASPDAGLASRGLRERRWALRRRTRLRKRGAERPLQGPWRSHRGLRVRVACSAQACKRYREWQQPRRRQAVARRLEGGQSSIY